MVLSVTEINLGNNGMVTLGKGDSVRIETPSGGGWGVVVRGIVDIVDIGTSNIDM